jgi:hypothetical protein
MTNKSKQSKEVVNYEEQMAKEAKAVAKTERVSADKFNLQSGILSYMGNPMPDNQMDVIILTALSENVHYAGDWDPDNITPPTCFALGEPGTLLHPHEVVPEPIHDNCNGCPYMKFKSAPNKKGKWCKEKRRLACTPYSEKPEDLVNSDLAMLLVPVMSVKNWSTYVNMVSAKYHRPSWGMVTRVKVVPDPKSQFRVTFTEVGELDSKFFAAVNGRMEAAKMMLETPYEMNPEPKEKEDDNNKKY